MIYNFERDIEEIKKFLIESKLNDNKNYVKKRKRKKEDEDIKIFNVPVSFDIETTSTYIGDEKFAFPYEWTFAIEEDIIYGRKIENFVELNKLISELCGICNTKKIVCYVHNLEYEFQFIRKYFQWSKVFAREERGVIECVNEFGFDFKCSYALSGYNLDSLAKNLTKRKIKKLYGDLDYTLVRTPSTPMTDEEMQYCYNDVLIVNYYIEECIEEFGDMAKIPLTNTGRVRLFCRRNCLREKRDGKTYTNLKYKRLMQKLVLNYDEYVKIHFAFAGGFTHANALYVGDILKNVSSKDFISDYPGVAVMEKYPMSAPYHKEITNEKEFYYYLGNYCCVFMISFYNLRKKKNVYDCPISKSKCLFDLEEGGEVIENNGRIDRVKKGKCTLYITNIDFDYIKMFYDWDYMEVSNFMYFKKDYLPKEFVMSILELYKNKTSLKGVEGLDNVINYMRSKGMLNSCYGMMVMAILRDEIVYNDEWGVEEMDVNKQIEDYNDNQNRFLYYVWGVFVTAYARKNLFSAIYCIGEDYVYSDTDSIKILNPEKHKGYFEKYNNIVIEKLKKAAEYHKIDIDYFMPKTIKGKVKVIGTWDDDGEYDTFKTLGAKRYMVEHLHEYGPNKKCPLSFIKKTGYFDDKYFHEISLTLAGLNEKGKKYFIDKYKDKAFYNFNEEMYIAPEFTGKMTHTYIDYQKEFYVTDYLGNTEYIVAPSSIHLENAPFSLNMADGFIDYIKGVRNNYEIKA